MASHLPAAPPSPPVLRWSPGGTLSFSPTPGALGAETRTEGGTTWRSTLVRKAGPASSSSTPTRAGDLLWLSFLPPSLLPLPGVFQRPCVSSSLSHRLFPEFPSLSPRVLLLFRTLGSPLPSPRTFPRPLQFDPLSLASLQRSRSRNGPSGSPVLSQLLRPCSFVRAMERAAAMDRGGKAALGLVWSSAWLEHQRW